MVLEGLRGYLQLANGLTEVTRERAMATAKALVAQGEAGIGAVLPTPVLAQVGSLTEDLMATSRANRDLLVGLVRGEVERSVARLGLVSAQDLEATSRRARGLERRVEELEAELSRAVAARESGAARATAKKATAKKATARKKAAAKKVTAKKTTAKPARKKTTAKAARRKTTAKAARRKTTVKRGSARTTSTASAPSPTPPPAT